MRLLEKQLEADESIITVWFDAWKFDREDAIWRALLIHTINELDERVEVLEEKNTDESNSSNNDLEKARKQLNSIQQQLYRSFTLSEKGDYSIDWHQLPKQLALLTVQTALPGSGLAAHAIKPMGNLIKGLLGTTQEKADDAEEGSEKPDEIKSNIKTLSDTLNLIKREESKTYFEHIRYLEQFQGTFKELTEDTLELLLGKDLPDKRLVFFIDDLDRCEPEKAIEVLEAIKLFLSNPNTVFVLGVDDQVIYNGLKKRYGDWLTQQASNNGNQTSDEIRPYHLEYLEKIIQLPFTLPALTDTEVRDFVAKRLPDGLQDQLFIDLIRLGCQYNPRKLNRLCQLLTLNFEIAKARELDEEKMAKSIMIKLVIIQLRDRSLYHELLNDRSPILRRLEKYWLEERNTSDNLSKQPLAESSNNLNRDRDDETLEQTQPSADKEEYNQASSPIHPWIKPYINYDWLKTLLLWKPPQEELQKECLSFEAITRPDNDFSLEEHLQLKPLTKLAEFVTDKQPTIILDTSVLQDLLHEDTSFIESAAGRIAREDRQHYANHLVDFIKSKDSPWRQCVSAGDAIGFLGDPRFKEENFWEQSHLWINIPKGKFYRGSRQDYLDHSENNEDGELYELANYEISRYLVTNHQYSLFIKDKDHRPPGHWREGNIPVGLDNHPVVRVSWRDAMDYIDWLNTQHHGYKYSLPTEAQWERAARGPAIIDGQENRRIFPWGDDFDATRCNIDETGVGRTTAVGCFPNGASPDGVLDMAGNVFEWCADWYDKSYYNKNTIEENTEESGRKAVRGGSFDYDQQSARCAFRYDGRPDDDYGLVGFRVARILNT